LDVVAGRPPRVASRWDTVPGRDGPFVRNEWAALARDALAAARVGLGLYIARRLAHDQDAELLLTDPTPPGHGARFELRLPLRAPTARQPILANVASSR
jgi:K+-sensing histidine kinase KdpD